MTASTSFAVAAGTPPPAGAAVQAVDTEAWTVATASGLSLRLPPSMRSLTTYVMLEQECWFEPEMSLLPLLLTPGMNCLDVGANHGIYTLEMARCTGTGQVIAFEPTQLPRSRLLRSVADAGMNARITVVDAGLADRDGTASFAVHDNSELNSREGAGAERETVRLLALDSYLHSRGAGLASIPIAFMKLDAEGDEVRVLAGARQFFAAQSPVVLFEYKHGRAVNTALLHAWAALGYGLFRWSAELLLLLPFEVATGEAAFALNLVAVRPAQQQELAKRGLLVSAAASAVATPSTSTPVADEALRAWCAWPAQRDLKLLAADGVYATALRHVATAHSALGVAAAERLAAVRVARDSLMVALGGGAPLGPEAWVLLLHCLHALGEQHAAVQLGASVLAQWPEDAPVDQPMMPPLRSDIERPRSTAAGPWLRQMLAEFVATHAAYSSYFQPPTPDRWGSLLVHPDHSAGIERRYLLAHVLCDRLAPVDKLTLLTAGRQTHNGFLWRGLIKTMGAMASSSAPSSPSSSGAGAGAGAETAAAVLAQLPVTSIGIVDVGASSLANETEPYAPLVAAGLAHVIGFEPDAKALDKLRNAHRNGGTHRYLPHFVGDGADAVFHETNWGPTGSLLAPDRAGLDRYHQLGTVVQEVAQHAVKTVRLDDVVGAGTMDVLKIDVQGAECRVFAGAAERLNDCLVVWTEVLFSPMYQGQPHFGDVDAVLRAHGLQLLCFAGLAQRTLLSWPISGVRQPQRTQQPWADAIYVPTAARLARLDPTASARLALVAHHMLGAFDLCHSALLQFDAASGSQLALRYLKAQSL